MPTNRGLDPDTARKLLVGQPVLCPLCGKGELVPRHSHKNMNTRFVCPKCREVFRPAKLI